MFPREVGVLADSRGRSILSDSSGGCASRWALRVTATSAGDTAGHRAGQSSGEELRIPSLHLRSPGPRAPGSLGSTANEIGITREFWKSIFGVRTINLKHRLFQRNTAIVNVLLNAKS